MAFSTISFLFLFLPVFLVVFLILPHQKLKNAWLLIASLFFYAWADLQSYWLLPYVILLNYLFGLISQHRDRFSRWYQAIFWVILLLNLLPLAYTKYAAFFLTISNTHLGTSLPIPAIQQPVGISFITFGCMAYFLDIHKTSQLPEANLVSLANFVTFFPKLAQGPITRYQEIAEGLSSRAFDIERISSGLQRFAFGFAKKILLADSLAAVANLVFRINPEWIGAGIAWYGLVGYGLQIYFDFSGYTDMAIGLGQIIGVQLPENFNHPYTSRSITDFWRRWHMTLTAWFRNYIFIPLEYKRRHAKFLRQPIHILIVFALTGFWHAASWNFIFWGMYYGIILSLEVLGIGKILKRIPAFLQHAYTLLIVMIGWVFFRLTAISDWPGFFKTLFGANGFTGIYTARSLNILAYWPVFAAAALFCLPLDQWIPEKVKSTPAWRFAGLAAAAALFFLSTAMLVSRGYQSFLYAQF